MRFNKKDEVCHSFVVEIFTKSLYRGGVSDGDKGLKLRLTWTLPCWSSKDNSFFKVFLFQISIVPFLKPQMITSWRIFKSFEGHFNPKIFNPMLQPQFFNPRLFNHELFNPKLFNYESGVSLGLKLGVQNSGVKMFGLYVSQNISTPVWGWKRSGLKLRVQMFRVERSFYLHIINVIWALESRFFSILSC